MEEPSLTRPDPIQGASFSVKALVVVLVIVAIAGGGIYLATRPGSPSVSTVAAAAGADSCTNSGYTLKTAVAGTQVIFDCFIGGAEKCVIYRGGLASDETALARLLFNNTLGASRPGCAS